MFPIMPPSNLLATAVIVAAKYVVNNNILFPSPAEDALKSTADGLKNLDMDELVVRLVDAIKQRSPEVVKAIENVSKEEMEAGTFDSIYISQIAAAQEFLNENHNADLSHIQRLLQKMMPQCYYGAIAHLKEHQDPAIICNIYGGQHLHAPNAQTVEQNWEKK